MVEEIFLHVGMHKTGSSAIQNSLTGYDDGTSFYADLGKPNQSRALELAFEPAEIFADQSSDERAVSRAKGLKDTHLQTLVEQAGRPGKRMILSGEGVCDMTDDGISVMKEALYSLAEKVKVYAYIREPVSFTNSYFAETIKHDLTEFEITSPRYAKRLGRIRDAFPDGAVEYRFFDPRNFEGGSLLDDFCVVAGLDRHRLPEGATENESLSFEAVQIIYALNRACKDIPTSYEKRRTFGAIPRAFLVKGGGRKFAFGADLLRSSIDPSDISWFETETGQKFDAQQLEQDVDGCVVDEIDLLTFRQTSTDLLHDMLNDRGISLDKGTQEEALRQLYDSFYSEAVVPRYKRRLRKALKLFRR